MKLRIIRYIIAALAIGALWYTLVLIPGTRRHDTLNVRIAEADQRLDDFSRTMKELPTFLEASQNLEALQKELSHSLYARSDILKLLGKITEDAIAHDLKVLEISPPVEELLTLNRAIGDTIQPQFLNIQLDMSGRYVDFGKYVNHLETTPYFRAVNFCNVRGQRDSRTEIDLTISFKALIGSPEKPA